MTFPDPNGQPSGLPLPAPPSVISTPGETARPAEPIGVVPYTQPAAAPYSQPTTPAYGQAPTAPYGQPAGTAYGQQAGPAYGQPPTAPYGQPPAGFYGHPGLPATPQQGAPTWAGQAAYRPGPPPAPIRRPSRPELGSGLLWGIGALVLTITGLVLVFATDAYAAAEDIPVIGNWAWVTPFVFFPVLSLIFMIWYKTRMIGLGILLIFTPVWIFVVGPLLAFAVAAAPFIK